MSRPYASIYSYTRPEREGGHCRLISRTALELTKALRSEGYTVRIEPEDGTAIEYYVRKGEFDILKDPLFLQLISIPIGILVNLASAWLLRRSAKEKIDSASAEANIAVKVLDNGRAQVYDHAGREVSEEREREVVELHRAQAEAMTVLGNARSPHQDMPFPICLEHTSKIVGWARLREDEKGLRADPAVIDDDETWERIQQGELQGLSIAGMVQDSECSICERDYVECNHISGLEYGGAVCVNTIKQLHLIEVSIVRQPVNPDCLINMRRRQEDD
jgi:protein-tyrosine-phosphatase